MLVHMRKLAGWLVLPLALCAFVVSNKHLLLTVPKVGFLLFKVAGGHIPGYIGESIFDYHEEWLKAGDVILSVPAKSGTTWMMYTIHQLQNKGSPPTFRDIYEEIPWIEFVYYPGQSMQERIEYMTNITSKKLRRTYKSHVPPPVMPVRDDVKYIVVIRNPFDAAASGRAFLSNHHARFAQMWGGFPPGAGEDALMPDAEWERMLLIDRGDGRPMADVFLFDIFRNWWPYRNQSNVLFMHYSDRVRNDVRELRKLSKFLDLDLTQAQLETVTSQVTFQETKKIQEKLESRYALDAFKQKGYIPDDVFILRTDKDGTMVSKGPQRKGTEEMSLALRTGIQQLLEKNIPPQLRDWFLNGGHLPVEVDI